MNTGLTATWLSKKDLTDACGGARHKKLFFDSPISMCTLKGNHLPFIVSAEYKDLQDREQLVGLSRFPFNNKRSPWSYFSLSYQDVQSIVKYNVSHVVIEEADALSWDDMRSYLRVSDGCTFIFKDPLACIRKIKQINKLSDIYKFCGETQSFFNMRGEKQALIYSITLYPIETVCPIYCDSKVDGIAVALEILGDSQLPDGVLNTITHRNIHIGHYLLFSNFEENAFYLDGITIVPSKNHLNAGSIYSNFESCYDNQRMLPEEARKSAKESGLTAFAAKYAPSYLSSMAKKKTGVSFENMKKRYGGKVTAKPRGATITISTNSTGGDISLGVYPSYSTTKSSKVADQPQCTTPPPKYVGTDIEVVKESREVVLEKKIKRAKLRISSKSPASPSPWDIVSTVLEEGEDGPTNFRNLYGSGPAPGLLSEKFRGKKVTPDELYNYMVEGGASTNEAAETVLKSMDNAIASSTLKQKLAVSDTDEKSAASNADVLF